ncbi:MAG: MBL fold metallo-hydrolase [Chitinophagaceae bacterium]|nr:MBL fold metallo-hydrolase [Chitinophagaceae bacterium]
MLIIKSFTFNPIQENTYLVYNERGECIIVDPGCYDASERKELTDFLSSHKLSPKSLLNTHCHLDHVFGNKFIQDEYGLTLQLHEEEEKMLALAPVSGERWGLPFDNYDGDLLFLKEGDRISLGDDDLTVLLTPGHSPGSLSFYCEAQHFVLSGDALFRSGIGRTDLPGGDYDTLINSIRGKLFALPDDTIVYSGHGVETTIGYEKKHNPFLA